MQLLFVMLNKRNVVKYLKDPSLHSGWPNFVERA